MTIKIKRLLTKARTLNSKKFLGFLFPHRLLLALARKYSVEQLYSKRFYSFSTCGFPDIPYFFSRLHLLTANIVCCCCCCYKFE